MSETTADRRSFLRESVIALGGLAAGAALSAGVAKADEGLDLEAAVQELLDERAIRAKISCYQRSMDRCDPELGYSVFWDDSSITVGEYFKGVTGKEFVDYCMKAHPNIFHTSHQITNSYITINGDKAGSESYAKPYFIYDNGDGTFDLGLVTCRYNDQWEKRNGEWRIVHRVVSQEGSARIKDVGDQGQADAFRAEKRFDDPSYEALAYGQVDA